jgi:uncharacterized protein (DUF2147 family)
MYGNSSQIAPLSLLHIFAISNADAKLLLIKLCVFTAIWISSTHSVYGGWPRSGEIDIMESKGNDDYVDGNDQNVGNTKTVSIVRCGPDGGHENVFVWVK